MPATPASSLDLLFPAHLIPAEVQAQLPPGYLIRPLSSTDYQRGHLPLLSVLTAAPDIGPSAWLARFHQLRSVSETYYVLVIVDADDRLVATGTVFLERKFLRGGGLVGHIEDIAVDKGQHGKSLGKRVIQALTAVGEGRGAYKVILDCSQDNIPFYEKCGYKHKEYEMVRYTPEDVLRAATKGASKL